MKVPTLHAALGTALILATAQPVVANSHEHAHGHRRAHQLFTKWHGQAHRDLHQSRAEQSPVETRIQKRATCTLPDDPDLVAVPGDKNGGFAMAPDRACLDGSYCPYACKPGKVMAQWKEGSRIAVGSSMDGGLYCDGGVPKKPFDKQPYCIDGTGTVAAQNDCGSVVSFCQTIFPGDEGMYIPSVVGSGSSLTLAVPGSDYWQGTSAHYYVNAPGVSKKEGCIWGTSSKAVGNWAAYVAGANTAKDGNTFLTLGWNPKHMDDFSGKMPNYGMKVECSGNCVGSCEINPSKTKYGAVISGNAGQGDAGNKYCVVTVPRGASAKIKVFSLDGDSAGSSSKAQEEEKPSASSSSSPPPPPPTTSSSTPPSTTTTTTSSVAPTTTTTTTTLFSSSLSSSSSSSVSSLSISTVRGGIFHENRTETHTVGTNSSAKVTPTPSQTFNVPTKIPEPTTNRNEGTQPRHGGVAIAGLVVALVASFWLC